MGDLFDNEGDASVSLFSTLSAMSKQQQQSDSHASVPEVPPLPESPHIEPAPEPEPKPAPETSAAAARDAPTADVVPAPRAQRAKVAPRSSVSHRPNDNVRRTISHIQQNINQRFDELFNIVESLAPKEYSQGVVLTNENILKRIQKEVNDSKQKDELLMKMQKDIDGMTDSVAEKEERNQLRKKIAEISEEIAAEIERFTEAQNDYDFSNSQIERNKSEFEQTESRNTFNEQRMRTQYNREIEKLKNEVEQLRSNLNNNIVKFGEEKEKLNKQIITLKKENEKMELQTPKVSQKDLEIFQKTVTDKLKDIVQSIIIDTYNTLNESINKEKKYTGKVIQTATKRALQNEASSYLN